MSRASTLFRLQETDLALDACRVRLGEIEKALAANPAVQAAQARLAAAEAALHQARATLKDIELSTQTLTNKIAEAEGRLYGGKIRNPKELQDLQADVEMLKRRRAASEDDQLNALVAFEAAEGEQAAAQTALTQAQETAARANTALNEEWDRLVAREANLKAERESLSVTIPAADRALYDRLRLTKKGRPLARLQDDTCGGCGIEPTAAIRQEARRGDLARCPGCERILYVE